MQPVPHYRCAGFTLLELLMAIAVFAVMSAMAYGGLASVLAVRHTLEQQAEELTALQMTFYRMSVDIEQALDRSSRNGTDQPRPPFVGGEGLEFFLELIHSGWSNPGKLARSGLQRVAYALAEQRIRRYYWQTLDGTPQEQPQATLLLQDVLAVEVRFMDRAMAWQTFWPPTPGATPESASGSLPLAVEIVIEKKGWGRIRRLFEVVSQK